VFEQLIVLRACISEARAPRQDEIETLAASVLRELFPLHAVSIEELQARLPHRERVALAIARVALEGNARE
jgi:hypothetical protein